jgi:stage II sporulation protein AB (anti-sigma F factor)
VRLNAPDVLSLDTSYEAVPSSVGQARRDVVALAERDGASEEDLERIRLAISEAVSNAVIHAYDDEPERLIHLTAAAIEGELTVLVADDGCGLGFAPESKGLGLGLAVITQLCDSLTVMTRSFGGTQIEMRFRLANVPPKGASANQLRGSVSSASRPA